MNKIPGHPGLYREATSLRAELQAELIMGAFAFVKKSAKDKAPISASQSLRAYNKLSMKAMEQLAHNPLLSKS